MVSFVGAAIGVAPLFSQVKVRTFAILGVMFAPFLGFAAATTAARFLPAPPPPPDPEIARRDWLDEVLAAVRAHGDLSLVQRAEKASSAASDD